MNPHVVKHRKIRYATEPDAIAFVPLGLCRIGVDCASDFEAQPFDPIFRYVLALLCFSCPASYEVAQFQIIFKVCVSKVRERISEGFGNDQFALNQFNYLILTCLNSEAIRWRR